MKERPILFSGEMVRAILDGRKTQTRRVVKQPRGWPEFSHCDPFAMPPAVWWWNGEHDRVGVRQECPYGQTGDRLWVRETFQGPLWPEGTNFPENGYSPEFCEYRADGGPRPEYIDSDDNLRQGWRSPIHMPRWASRITLEIISVRVERLQGISEEDAQAEGVAPDCPVGHIPAYQKTPHTYCFAQLWESINSPGSWDANPWVWVIEFRRIEP